jgi:hypothetical protein
MSRSVVALANARTRVMRSSHIERKQSGKPKRGQTCGVINAVPFGPEHSVFKVAGRMFALGAHLPGACDARAAGDLHRF